MRFITLLALALLIAPFTHAAESKLPADATKLVEAFDTDAAKIRADAEKAVDKRAAELTAKLQKAQDAAMKRGDLDGANAIKAAIEKAAPNAVSKSGGSEIADPSQLLHAIPRMNAKEWDALPGTEITVMAAREKTDTGITLAKNERYIVVPHPTDLWAMGPKDKYANVKWDGEIHMMIKVGAADSVDASLPGKLVAQGEGELMLSASDGNFGDNWGSVRVKILKVTTR